MAILATARSINVKRTELLEKLKTNRTKHAEDFKIAMQGYRIEVEKIIHKAVTAFTNDEKAFDNGFYISEEVPQDHTGDYDDVIAMMEMSIDEVINLDSTSFQQFVLDNWSWKQSFTATTAKYVSNVMAVGK